MKTTRLGKLCKQGDDRDYYRAAKGYMLLICKDFVSEFLQCQPEYIKITYSSSAFKGSTKAELTDGQSVKLLSKKLLKRLDHDEDAEFYLHCQSRLAITKIGCFDKPFFWNISEATKAEFILAANTHEL